MKARYIKLFVCLYLLAGAVIARVAACTVTSAAAGSFAWCPIMAADEAETYHATLKAP